MDTLHDQISSQLERILNLFDGLRADLQALALEVAKKQCPDPGACLLLKKVVEGLAHTIEGTTVAVAECKADVEKLAAWRIGTSSIIAACTFVVIIWPAIRHVWGLFQHP